MFRRKGYEDVEDGGWSVDFSNGTSSGTDVYRDRSDISIVNQTGPVNTYDYGGGSNRLRLGGSPKGWIIGVAITIIIFISLGMLVTNIQNPKVMSFTDLNDLYFYRFISKHTDNIRNINSEFPAVEKSGSLDIQRRVAQIQTRLKSEYVTVNKRKTSLTQTKSLLLEIITLESKLYSLLETRINIVDAKEKANNVASTKSLQKQISQKMQTLIKQNELLKNESV